ncbi:hypothetical protein EV368DRAFT_80970 [Lentinula lateritia]|uniref:Uncharacterized protein n=1 Tax=Lentinula aff. lateritia TaxID=2804960 RepID=A0ACC1U476_9AGAR|nr:hypothetical protein F5876DRAFT_75411 [Lentinula aff. lateritia]KAJ3854046.1 hypothetical protein EV368DRAFT_80970 [Lentinula lateritia]
MKFLSTTLLYVAACVWATQAAYLSIHDQEQPWAGFQEGIMITPVLDELDSQYLCDVTIDNEVFQISVHSTSQDDWTSNTLDGREPPDEHITIIDQYFRLAVEHLAGSTSTSKDAHSSPLSPSSSSDTHSSISCQHVGFASSTFRRRIGFMHAIDLLSIIGVGFLAATASGVAALLRRYDQLKRHETDIPRALQLDYLHEHPNSDDTEQVFDYIKSKLC